MMKYQYHTSLTSPKDFPFLLRKAQFILEGEERKRIREGVSHKGLWGDVQTFVVLNDDTFPFPSGLEIEWISVVEQKCFCINMPLDAKYMEKMWLQYAQEEEDVDDDEEGENEEDDAVTEDDEEEEENIKSIFNYVAVGIAPHGGVAVWLHGWKKQSIIAWLHAEEKELTLDEQRALLWGLDIKTYCDAAVKQLGLESVVIPEPKLFENLMQQYSYKWHLVLKKWDENEYSWKDYQQEEILPELDFIDVKCFDGTYDKFRDGSLMEYHTAGKPSRMTVKWHVAKRRYSAYFSFDHDQLKVVFSRCYGAHPDTKVDILVHMDPETNHYELALYRYGMKEPLKIDESVYQLMVFRNKFECFRSENYNLPPGSWRW
jgi:hypothetical protein